MSEAALKLRVRRLYYGDSKRSRIFQLALIAVDLAAIAYFLITVKHETVGLYRAVDLGIFTFFLVELLVRFWIDPQRRWFFVQISTIGDLIVLTSLLLPLIVDNLGFLRILRTLRFLRLFRIAGYVRQILPAARKQEDVAAATLNLLVYVFVVTSAVWVLEAGINPDLENWIDALYFTVSTLTTTGYGDITLQDPLGRLFTVGIMIFGVALFLRLVQSIFRPYKVAHTCGQCGLTRHDPDASHCKHCGKVIHIETEGSW